MAATSTKALQPTHSSIVCLDCRARPQTCGASRRHHRINLSRDELVLLGYDTSGLQTRLLHRRLGQRFPHRPQWSGLVRRLTQVPLQLIWLFGQHLPLEQMLFAGQARPQEPQLRRSLCRFLHWPLQFWWVNGQQIPRRFTVPVGQQIPLEQELPFGHARPQPPQ